MFMCTRVISSEGQVKVVILQHLFILYINPTSSSSFQPERSACLTFDPWLFFLFAVELQKSRGLLCVYLKLERWKGVWKAAGGLCSLPWLTSTSSSSECAVALLFSRYFLSIKCDHDHYVYHPVSRNFLFKMLIKASQVGFISDIDSTVSINALLSASLVRLIFFCLMAI